MTGSAWRLAGSLRHRDPIALRWAQIMLVRRVKLRVDSGMLAG
jgi:hypothetical protein